MRQRIVATIGFFALFAAVAAGQQPANRPASQPARAATKAIPRTADGHPDLQGMYDVATMTPVERPNEVKSLVLTKEEAAALEVYEQQRQVKNDAPLDPNRAAPPVGGENTTPKSYLEVLEKFGGGPVGGYNNFWLAGGMNMLRSGL